VREINSLRVEKVMKNFCIAVLFVAMAGVCFAQAPQSSVSVPNTDVFVGYIMTSPDYGGGLFAYRLNGFEGAFSKGLSSHFAVVATGDVQFGDIFIHHATQFSGTVGGKYSFLTGRFRPYGIGQAGFAHQNSNGAYAHDVVDGLTFRMGGGADLQLTPKLYWRIAQFDEQRMPWARHRPYYVNISSGIGYRF
jgi:hypothetical protein